MRAIIVGAALLLLAACLHRSPEAVVVRDDCQLQRCVVVVVAASDLPAGTVLTEEDLRTERWPPEAVEGRYTSLRRDAVGLQLTQALGAGDPIRVGARQRTTIEIIRGGTTAPECMLPADPGCTMPARDTLW